MRSKMFHLLKTSEMMIKHVELVIGLGTTITVLEWHLKTDKMEGKRLNIESSPLKFRDDTALQSQLCLALLDRVSKQS